MFKSDSNPSVSNSDENSTIVLASAGAVSPVNELNAVNRAALCKTASVLHVQRNDQIKPEGANRWLMYLVEGTVSLYQGKDEVGTISARTNEALQPLFQDKTAYQSIRTSSVAKIVKFGREQLDILLREQQKNAIHVIDVVVSEVDNIVFDDIVADMATNKVLLGSSVEACTKILASYKKVGGIPELAEIIQSDPALTTQVMRVANRMEGGSESTQSIRGAISRLGVEATQRTIEDLLRSNSLQPKSPLIDQRLKRYLQRTMLSSAIVQVLAKSVPELKPDVATVVAMTADIGELLALVYANKHAEKFLDAQQLAATIENLRTILSSWVMSAWDFPEDFIDATHTARDWYRNLSGQITYTDLVTASLLIIQQEMPDNEHSSIPNAANLLLARRLQQAGIDLTSPGEIVRAATGKIVSVQALLKAG